jgi:hypothetical protein
MVNGATDIGAYEVQQPANRDPPMSPAGIVAGGASVLYTASSLRRALALASAEAIPSWLLRSSHAAIDRFFVSFFPEQTRGTLSRYRHEVPGKAETLAVDLLATDLIARPPERCHG